MSEFLYKPMFNLGEDSTQYRKIEGDFISKENFNGEEILVVAPDALETLAYEAFHDVAFYQREAHLEAVKSILDDPESSGNDKFVAETLLKNAVISAEGILPFCQDTGTAIVMGHKGEKVWTGCDDKERLSSGIYKAYNKNCLRYSQIIPLDMCKEKNSATNLPAQLEIYADKGDEYEFLFVAKGGGSANKTYLYQQTKALLTPEGLEKFFKEKLTGLGTAACPPYHVCFVIGGTSAEFNLKTVKLASAGYLDNLPTKGDEAGIAFRDLEWEDKILKMAQESGIGAQFGGKAFAHDIKVIRMPRHAASCPVGLGLSCSADRNIKAKITSKGVFIEKLEKEPSKYLGSVSSLKIDAAVDVDLDEGMDSVRKKLSSYPVGTRLNLKGTLIVARDMAHAKIFEDLNAGKPMPEYFKNHPIYYAGPAKKPKSLPSGSFGPTTAQRMDSYTDCFMAEGGSMVMLAKGNRSDAVSDACKKHGGFYLGSIGGPAAILAHDSIKNVEIVDFEDFGMEAVRKIEIENFPAFIICDDKGNDLYKMQ